MIHIYAMLETLRAQALSLSLQINDLEAWAVELHCRCGNALRNPNKEEMLLEFLPLRDRRDDVRREAQEIREVLLPLWKEIDALEKELGVAS